LCGGDTLNFTQEFLAEMLGVRRTSVTVDARALQAAGLVKYARGKIQIVDVEGRQEAACECCQTVKLQYDQLLGSDQEGGTGLNATAKNRGGMEPTRKCRAICFLVGTKDSGQPLLIFKGHISRVQSRATCHEAKEAVRARDPKNPSSFGVDQRPGPRVL
jgi:hypothetical protein